MDKLAYDCSNTELVDEFWRAVARAGVSNSGLVIDTMAGSDRAEDLYFRGVLLSRLEGKERPFIRGDRVQLLSSKSGYSCSVNRYDYSRGSVEHGKVYEVSRTFYENDGKWSLIFKGDEYERRYSAELFEIAKQQVNV